MRYLALATDYDGTLAWHGVASETSLDALRRLRDSGRRSILVTGRELDDLASVFPHLELFDRIVAENGALLYRPDTHERKPLGEAPPRALIDLLTERGVPLSIGSSILATVEPHESTVVRTIHELGLEHQVIFNKGSVMILPPGVNKGTGLVAALDELSLSTHNTVAIGDAENDHAFLASAELGVAVADALPTLKERADFVTTRGEGEGVVEIVEILIADDLASLETRLTRQDILLGATEGGETVSIRGYGASLLVAGPSGSGKTTTTMGILERLAERGYQFCLIDPEGDYGAIELAVTIGGIERAPTPDEVIQLLHRPPQSVVVNLTGLSLSDRPAFFAGLLPRLLELRAHVGRPHWIIVDEAHHLLPAVRGAAPQTIPQELRSIMMVTLEPQLVSPAALAQVDTVIAVGPNAESTLQAFARAVGLADPLMSALPTGPESSDAETAGAAGAEGNVWVWAARAGRPPILVRALEPRSEHLRHRRKYAEGDLGEDRSFYFTGPDQKLNLRAQNLNLFIQIADGIDDASWTYHLRRGDYSRWFSEMIKDPTLARETAEWEADPSISPSEGRRRISAAIRDRYTV